MGGYEIKKVDYFYITESKFNELIEDLINQSRPVIIQEPFLEGKILEQVDKSKFGPEKAKKNKKLVNKRFRELIKRLKESRIKVNIVTASPPNSKGYEWQQWGFVEKLKFGLTIVSLTLFVPIGYILKLFGKENLRKDIIDKLTFGPIRKRINRDRSSVEEELKNEATSLKEETGKRPVILVQAGLFK